jgi:hypothetical protein
MSKADSNAKEAPQTKRINGQTAARVDCSLRAWRGHVYAPLELNTQQYLTWWEKYQTNGGIERKEIGHLEDMQRLFGERAHMILEYHIEGFDPEKGTDSYALLNFFAAVTQPLIIEARFLPNLPGWSNGFTNGSVLPSQSDEAAAD